MSQHHCQTHCPPAGLFYYWHGCLAIEAIVPRQARPGVVETGVCCVGTSTDRPAAGDNQLIALFTIIRGSQAEQPKHQPAHMHNGNQPNRYTGSHPTDELDDDLDTNFYTTTATDPIHTFRWPKNCIKIQSKSLRIIRKYWSTSSVYCFHLREEEEEE